LHVIQELDKLDNLIITTIKNRIKGIINKRFRVDIFQAKDFKDGLKLSNTKKMQNISTLETVDSILDNLTTFFRNEFEDDSTCVGPASRVGRGIAR